MSSDPPSQTRPPSRASTHRQVGLDETLSAGDSGAPSPGPRSSTQELQRGDALGRYLVVAHLGAGAMGVVYRAYDPDLDRSVALKLVGARGERARGGSEDEHHRLLREAQAMARLSHPNVITVYDVGTLDDAVFVAMELVEGGTLRQWLQQETRTLAEILAVFDGAGRGLAAAHRAGIVHRDFKPDNVMVARDPEGGVRVRVLDFGLARAQEHVETGMLDDLRSNRSSESLDASLTIEGAVVGTPAYMAPEQHAGERATRASDQFAFCVALFEALYGIRPFRAESLSALAFKVLQGDIAQPPSTAQVPRHIHEAILRGLSVDPQARHRSMDELLDALALHPRRRRWPWLLGLGGGVAAASLGGWLGFAAPLRTEPCSGGARALDEVWTTDRSQTLAAAFEATDYAFADETWAAIEARVQSYADAWVSSWHAACRATRVTREQSEAMLDLRMTCLDRRRRRLDEVLDVLEAPDLGVLTRALDAVEALEPVDDCNDLSRLQGGPDAPRPDLVADVERLEGVIDRVVALASIGRYQRATETLEPVWDELQAIDYAPVRARGSRIRAILIRETGEQEDARALFADAFREAIEAGDDALAVDVARHQADLIGYAMAQTERGRDWLAIGRAHLERSGASPRELAAFHAVEGSIATAAGEFATALDAHHRALEIWEAEEPSSLALGNTLDDIGAVQTVRGELDRAIELHRRALEIKRSLYGSLHPNVADSLRELGNATSKAERFEEAKAIFEEALAIQREARGPHNREVAVLLDDLGRVHRKMGELERAVALHREALELWKRLLGDPHPDLAVSILNIGYTLNAAGRFTEALTEFERAIDQLSRSVGSSHPHVVYATNAAASALVDLERYAEAWVHVERILSGPEVDVDPTLLAETRFIGTHALWADGRSSPAARARARVLAEEARDIYAAKAELWQPQVDKIQTWLDSHR